MHPLTWLLILFSFSYGNISRMAHELAHGNADFSQYRDVAYAYDQLDRLTKADDAEQDYFDEAFEYDAQGRMIAQRRDTSVAKNAGGEYAYYANTNRLKSIANGMGGTADDRNMSDANNFVYDSEGNLIEDKSKKMRITYDWRGMPMEFVRRAGNGDSLKLVMAYDGSGKRISKTSMRKMSGGEWDSLKVTHYTGIGTEIRENFSGGSPETKVVVNMPQGLGRYGIENANGMAKGDEFYLKNHLGSTMMVAQVSSTNASEPAKVAAAYDYRSFGEQVTLTESADKVTENFTGKENDDETQQDYFGARYLDPMLGVWISVDPKRFFPSPYLYMGNGYNPILFADLNGEEPYQIAVVFTHEQVYGAIAGQSSDLMKDYYKTMKWGKDTFGEDFAMKIITNEDEYLDFIQNGKYTATVSHGITPLYPAITPGDDTFFNLRNVEDGIGDEHVGVFSCFSGNWGDQLSKITVNPENKGLIEDGDAFKQAAKFLTDGFNSEKHE